MASTSMEECYCYELLKIEKTRHEIRAWKDDPRLKINFNFSIQTSFRNYSWMAPYVGITPVMIPDLPNWDSDDFVFGGAVFAASFSDADVREAVGRAVEGSGLRLDWRPYVVERALKEVREWCPKGGRAILDLDFKVVIEHVHVHYQELAGGYDYPRMIPAADSAMGMLEKCEAGGATAERCCCICLEEFGGEEAAAARMPCKHVFHGGCIKEWLRTSHYCPLCRYEMPTE